jgi:hypothetical protein
MKKVVAILTIAASFILTNNARADFIISGYSQFGPPATPALSDGIVNFAVYDTARTPGTGNSGPGNNNGTWTDDFGVITPQLRFGNAIHASARFVYMLQVINTNPVAPDNQITSFIYNNFYGTVTSGGVFTAFGILPSTFIDADGAILISSATNVGIGPEPGAVSDIPGNQTPQSTGGLINASPLTIAGVGVIPGSGDFTAVGLNIVVAFTGANALNTYNGASGPSTPPFSSTVIWFTSDYAPWFPVSGTSDGVNTSQGDIPSPNPEPTSMSLMGLGLVGLVGYRWRKRKQAA